MEVNRHYTGHSFNNRGTVAPEAQAYYHNIIRRLSETNEHEQALKCNAAYCTNTDQTNQMKTKQNGIRTGYEYYTATESVSQV